MLFCIFAFGRSTCCIQIVNDGLILFSCIGYTLGILFFNRYSYVSLQCPIPSLVITILFFSFHVAGRHCLVEILRYIMSFCFFGGVPYFVS